MGKYIIKTRNWNNKRIGYYLLRPWSYYDSDSLRAKYRRDLDIKCYVITGNPVKAWLLWGLWKSISGITGGWTYIVRPHSNDQSGYKSIY